MTMFKMPRLTGAKQPLETLADPKPADTTATAETGLGQKIDGRKANKKVRTAQFNTGLAVRRQDVEGIGLIE